LSAWHNRDSHTPARWTSRSTSAPTGHAILQQNGILMQECYTASGTIFQNGKLVEASEVLGHFDTEGEAQQAGLAGRVHG